ncbi:MAG: sialidase family protein [Solirubrobacteraceae bacterium]
MFCSDCSTTRYRDLAILGSIVLLAALAATLPAVGQASPFRVKGLQAISGPSPFAAGCPGALHDDTNITGYELEPMITVNPANRRNIIATWKQDAGPFDGTRSDLIASSPDNGKTWSRSTIPGIGVCTGGTADAVSDPWVSAARDGNVYFGGLAADLSTEPPTTAVVASHSSDGGRTWLAPATVASPLQGNETDAITGSPTRAGHAYMAWANFIPSFPFPASSIQFSRTTDGGATWSPTAPIDQQPGPFTLDFAPRILVLPDSTLLAIFGRADGEAGLGIIFAARSLDDGKTWLPAVKAGSKPIFPDFLDPETGDVLPQPAFESTAVAPDGTVYIAFEDSRSASTGAIGVVTSRDGGLTWRSEVLPGVSAFAFEPAVAVDKHGTVGVMWYDLRDDVPGDAALTADVWFAHSDDRGASWKQTHVAGPTDLRNGPLVNNRVGEYQGLVGLRHGFAAAFALRAPQAQDGPSDIFFARIGPGK